MKRWGARSLLIACVALWAGTLWALNMGAFAQELPLPQPTCQTINPELPRYCTSPSSSGSPTPSGSPTTQQPKSEKSTLTIKYAKDKFSGAVSSKSASCERGRDVSVKKKGGKVIGSDTTDRAGKWSVRYPKPKGKRYFAKVAPRVGGATTCEGAKSKTIRAK